MKTLNINKVNFKSEEMKKTVLLLLDNGFNFYTSLASRESRENPTITYGYYEDGENLAYLQDHRFGGLTYSTVHKSVNGSGFGTGFGLCEYGLINLTIEDLRKGFIFAPQWAKGDLSKIRKYKGINDYINSSAVNRILEMIQITK